MSDVLQNHHARLLKTFGGATTEHAGEITVILPAERILEAARLIHDEMGFDYLAYVTAVDYWPEENPRFHVAYTFRSLSQKLTLHLRAPVAGIKPSLASIESVYRNANWQEREVYDMFGIHFEGHSDLRRILMPADWVGHPQRKDYPLGYEEPQYSFNFDEIKARKPAPKE
ncbi:MAG: NADH-quinone oxidoreductase subunit C [Anaerolineales bacterium]|jgi:NADH-quinone oxidoreductase subunit C|nr:NADH-quinone oxidoreductase subunit C [Anaerolineales bacterium]